MPVDFTQDSVDITESDSDSSSDPEDDSNMLNMLEAYSAANSKQKGSYLKAEIVWTFLFTEFQPFRKTQRT